MKKIVLKVELYDEKVKQKAMKVVSGLSGVDSIAMEMKEKRLTVTGDIDPFTIVAKLRKLCHTEIVTVGPAVAEKKKEDNAAGKKEDNKKPEAKKEESAGGAKKKEETKKKETPKKDENSSQQAAIIPCHQMPYGPYYNYPPAPPPAYNYPPPPQQLYYNQQAYSYQQSPAPTQYYYHRNAEDDPNSCVIC